MDAKQLRKSLPKNLQMPDELVKLCQYTEEQGADLVVCDFMLTDYGAAAVEAWMGDKAATKVLTIFGMDDMQSLYGFWLYDKQDLAEAPIVYLHHESTGNTVLANSLREFLSLLALGKAEVGLIRGWGEQTEECEDTDAFRSWLESELGITPAKDGRALVKQAQRAHPNFDKWIEEWRKQHGVKR